jgi:hypothetical protein
MVVGSIVAVSDTRGAVRLDGRAFGEGGFLSLGTSAFDYIDPALVLAPGTTPAAVAWALEDATWAKLLRYPTTRC